MWIWIKVWGCLSLLLTIGHIYGHQTKALSERNRTRVNAFLSLSDRAVLTSHRFLQCP